MTHHELFGPRGLGWRPVTPQGWAMLWAVVIVASISLFSLVHG
jgi:hypothetical protein